MPTSTRRQKVQSERPAYRGRTFYQMIHDKQLTSRVMQEQMRIGSRTILKAEADPSILSLADVVRLAGLLEEPVERVMADLLGEIEHQSAEATAA